MAPLRNNRSSNRSGRSQVDHDVFEGLPVRHWRKAPIAVSTAPQKDEATFDTKNDTLFTELPMPRDSHLLSSMSQALLRAARSGVSTKKAPAQPLPEEDKENGEEDEPAGDVDSAFMAKRWAAVPRHLEGLEPEFLAKRRKGLPSAYTGSVGQANGAIPMRKTKVRKFDADGNATVLEVLVPEGQTVGGEVFDEEPSATEAPPPGTVVEGVGVANAEGIIVAGDQILPTPPRRRPPPPKRKAKGPGRGRKKKVAFAPGAEGMNPDKPVAVLSDGLDEANGVPQGQDPSANTDGDVAMVDGTPLQNGEESSEEDEEGDEGDEGEKEEGELSSSPTSIASPIAEPPAATEVLQAEAAPDETPQVQDQMIEEAVAEAIPSDPGSLAKRDASSSPDLPLVTGQAESTSEEIAALSNMSSAMDDRILAPDKDQELISMQELPNPVEQLPTETPIAAEIPPAHNPLEGLTAPEPGIVSEPIAEPEADLSDGEIDLLGSLEQQLNRNEADAGAMI
ncbi:MAG: hypothetical protein Q9218_005465 [Villophora microphyllina]